MCRFVMLIAVLASTTAAVRPSRAETAGGENIARGKPYLLSPQPDYGHCTDPGDTAQLTDGQLTEGYFWTQQGTVGWQAAKYVTITVDLGKVEPIGGASFRTAAGVAGVQWPASIRIQVSDDGKGYREVGDLIGLDDAGEPLPTGYAVRRFSTSKLQTRGRYVRFMAIPSGPYVFCDEVEIFRGPNSLVDRDPGGEPATDAETLVLRYRIEAGIRRRYDRDLAAVEARLGDAKLAAETTRALADRLSKVRAELDKPIHLASPLSFRAIVPLNDTHAELFRIQAAIWQSGGHARLTAWPACPWDPIDPFAPPPRAPAGSLQVHTMRGEYRSAAFNIANASDQPVKALIQFAGIPGSPSPPCVTVHEVLWTDTVSGEPVASALPEATRADDGWQVTVRPGLVQQVWLTFHVTNEPPGEHTGRVTVSAAVGDDISLPVRLRIYPISFPAQTTLWVGGWSYTDGEGSRGVTLRNRPALLAHLQSRFVNAPWASPQVMLNCKFDDGDPPKVTLDTQRFDDWIAQWPNAAARLVFLSVGNTFAGTQLGSDAFNQRVGIWISAWVRHLRMKGVQPSQLGLLIVDEPHAHEQDDTIIAWAKAIKAAEPAVLIWNDPIWSKPQEARPELFATSDIICPNRTMWLQADKSFAEFYLDQRKKGRTLQFYSCNGPARLLDPYTYYRLQAWHAWQVGATGSFFWAFGDTGGTTSWNEYAAVSGPWTPQFLDETSVTAAKQMEAIRESVEDYEYLVMLRKALEEARAAGRHDAFTEKAAALLTSGVNEVLTAGGGVNETLWHAPKDRTRADAVRVQILEALLR